MDKIKQISHQGSDSDMTIKFWGNMVIPVIGIVANVLLVRNVLQLAETPISYVAMAFYVLVILASFAVILLTLRGHQKSGAQLAFYAQVVFFASGPFFYTGRAITTSISLLVVSAILISLLLPKELRRRSIVITGVTLAILWVIEWIQPPWRIQPGTINGTNLVASFLAAIILGVIVIRASRNRIASSIRLQITLWTGLLVAILSITLVGYSIYTGRQAAIHSAEAEALAVAEAHATEVKGQIDPALNVARTLANTLSAVKDVSDPTPMTREQINGILRKVAEENPSFLGTWTLWEPNAFDGRDADYVNAPLHDASGRFIPYWVRANDTVEGVAIVDYETPTPGLNDWYYVPRETGKETLTAPYLYPIDGVDVLISTVAVPIIENHRFYGVAGVDYRTDFVQGLVDDIDLYDGAASAVLFTETGTLVAVRNQPELTLQPANSIYQDFEQFQSQISAGRSFFSLSPDGRDLRVFYPINIGEAGRWWFGLVVPFSEITAPATVSVAREAVISLGLIVASLLVLWYLTGQIVRPILDLTTVADAISGGNLNASARLETANEIGILAKAFNSMTSQIRNTFETLEQRVTERTHSLELAAEVGRSVSQVRALDVMLRDACERILEDFELYYVQVYLTDPAQTTLRLEAGTGEVGAQLLGRAHSLPVNTSSINGRAVVEKHTVVISNTSLSPTFRPNPLLPETHSEMAVPLIVGESIVGVLDMQARQPGTLNEEVLPAFEALAGQLAVAIQNAKLLDETQQARAEVEAQARRLARTGWSEYLDAIHKPERIGFVFERNQIVELDAADTASSLAPASELAVSAPIAITGETLGSLVVEMDDEAKSGQSAELVNIVARQVAQQIENLRLLESGERYRHQAEQAARRQTIEGWQAYVNSRTPDSLGYLFDMNEVRPYTNGHEELSSLALPLKARGQTVGKLAVDGLMHEDGESLELANAVAEQLGAHIESLRLLEETRQGQVELDRRAQQLAAVAEISTISSGELDVQKMLETVVHLTQRKFGLYHAHVFIFNGVTQILKIAACGWKEGDPHEGTHGTAAIPIDQEQSLVARAARTRQAVIVNDVHNEPGWLPNPLLPDTQAEMAVPLVIGDQVLGVLDVQASRLNAFNEEDASIQTTLASQVATSLQNARTFMQAQKQAEREAMLNAINQKIQSATSVEAVLQIAARELGHALGAPMTIAQLSMKDRAS